MNNTFWKKVSKNVIALVLLISLGLTAQVCESQYGKIVIDPETTYGYAPQYIEATSYYNAIVNITWDFYDTKLRKNSVLEYLGNEWIDISDRIVYKLISGHHTYSLLNIPFQVNQTRDVRITAYTPINTTGKYDLYIWQGDWNNPSIRVMCDPYWNVSFNYRMNITVESKTNEPAYSVKIVLNTSNFNFSKANTSGWDIRFTNISDDLLPMFIENYSSMNSFGILWFKGNLSIGNNTFWMYYGNDDALNISNPNQVFIEYDDFEDASLNFTRWDNYTDSVYVNTSKYVVGSQSFYFVPQSKAYVMDTTPSSARSVLTEAWFYDNGVNNNNFFSCMSQSAFSNDYIIGKSSGAYIYATGGVQRDVALPESTGWHKLGCIINSSRVYYFFTNQQYNYTLEAFDSATSNWNGTAMGDINGGATKSWGHYDFYRTRYYTSGGLIYTFGTEEVPPALTNITVELKYPVDTNINNSFTIIFGYEPNSSLEIKNSSLWWRKSGTGLYKVKKANTSEVINASINEISYNAFTSEFEYEWFINVCDISSSCKNSSIWEFTYNYTMITPDIAISIEIGADQPYTELCANTSHLERTLTKKICDNVGCVDIKIGENISCPYGCFEDSCAPSPSGASWNILWFFAGMVVLIFVLWIFVGKR